jgi:hypothetical protein
MEIDRVEAIVNSHRVDPGMECRGSSPGQTADEPTWMSAEKPVSHS